MPDEDEDVVKAKKRKEKKARIQDGGKTLLPFSRVQKIIKADKDLPMMTKDATFLISLATEEFITRLSRASQVIADRENRATVQQRDLVTVVRKTDEFIFLEDIVTPITATLPTRRQPKASETFKAAPTMLDQYVVPKGNPITDDNVEEKDIVMNEDGTMYG